MKSKRLISLCTAVIMAFGMMPSFLPAGAAAGDPLQDEANAAGHLSAAAEDLETYTNRFIVKFASQPVDQPTIENAFSVAKAKKALAVSNAVEKLQAEQKSQEAEELQSVFSVIQDMSSEPIKNETIDQYQLITLREPIAPETFAVAVQEQTAGVIEYIQPDYLLTLSAEADPTEPEFSSAPVIDTALEPEETADTVESTDESIVRVGLIDSAVDASHPDLAGHVTGGYDFCQDQAEIVLNETQASDIHGTNIAGIIVQNAPEAQVVPLKVFENGRAYTSDIIRAIQYAKENHIQLINCSWGSSDNNQALLDTMSECADMLFICAAGNAHRDLERNPVYPASFQLDNIISVAAADENQNLSYFSNYGDSSVDIAVQGSGIESAWNCGTRNAMRGTSVAAGVITGAAAEYGKTNDLSLAKDAVLNSADMLSCLEPYISSGRYLNTDKLTLGLPGEQLDVPVILDEQHQITAVEDSEGWELFSQLETRKVAIGTSSVMFLKSDNSLYLLGQGKLTLISKSYISAVDISVQPREDQSGTTGDMYLVAFANGTVDCYSTNGDLSIQEWHVLNGEEYLSNITAVSAGFDHFLALDADGRVWAWGEDMWGQAGGTHPTYIPPAYPGDPDVYTGFASHGPAQVKQASNRTAIIAGNKNSYSIDSEGILSHWGCDGTPLYYERDISPFNITDKPVAAVGWGTKADLNMPLLTVIAFYSDGTSDIADNANFQNVIKADQNIYLKADGTVWVWSETNNEIVEQKIEGLPSCANVFARNGSYVAVANNGTVWCFGNNAGDKFNVGTSGNITTPRLVGMDGNVNPEPVMMDDQQFNNSYQPCYQASQAALETMGWKEVYNADNGEFTAESGQLILKKTSPQNWGDGVLTYGIEKTFSHRENNWHGDERASVWTNNFKGQYEIRTRASFRQPNSQIYYDVMGKDNSGQECVVARYRVDPGASANFSVYNNGLNKSGVREYPLWTNPQENRLIRTMLRSADSTFQTFKDWGATPVATTLSGANPADTFNMTDWNRRAPGAYVTGIRISVQAQAPQNAELAKIDSVQLIEHLSDTDDNVEGALESLRYFFANTGTLSPAYTTEDLPELPTTLNGTQITYTSSHPGVLSPEGKLLVHPPIYTDVTLTAKVTNPINGYTKYLDYVITVADWPQNYSGEGYSSAVTGKASGMETEGTKAFTQYPQWRFSYPGIKNGTNGQLHAGQVLVKNNRLILKKISDRQTPSYQPCVVGIRPLDLKGGNTVYEQIAIGFNARAYDTGSMYFAPVTAEGQEICQIWLDASVRKVNIAYGALESGSIVRKTQTYNINPTVDQEYLIFANKEHKLTILAGGQELITPEQKYFLPGAENTVGLSKLKTWITNITYGNKEMGNLGQLRTSDRIAIGDTELQQVWNDIEGLREAMPEMTETDLDLPTAGPSGSRIIWTSSAPQYIAVDGTLNRPAWYQADQKVTLTANVTKGAASQTVDFTVLVPHQAPDAPQYVYTTDDTMIYGGVSGLVGTERYGWNPTAAINTTISNQKLTGRFAMLKFDLSGHDASDMTYAQLELTQLSGSRNSKYKVAVMKNDTFNKTWQQNSVTYPDIPAQLSDLDEIGEITLSRTNTGTENRTTIFLPVTELVQAVKEKPAEDQVVTLAIYSTDNNTAPMEIAMSEWAGIHAPGSCRPRIYLTRESDSSGEYDADVPVRTLGREFEQTYSLVSDCIKPEITKVSERIIDDENGIYEFSINDGQYTADPSANPFFFWSSMEGTFTALSPDYRSVRFRIDPESRGRQVKVIVGMGDGLGYVDRKAITVGLESSNTLSPNLLVQPLTLELANNQVEQAMTDALPENAVVGQTELSIGLDFSLDMLPFDPGSDLRWLETVESLIESAPADTTVRIADAQNSTYYKTGNAAIEAVQSFGQQRYSEQASASALLEAWSALLRGSNGRNKLAVLFVNQSIEASALARTVSNMREQGTAVVVLALGTEDAGNSLLEQIPGVYSIHSMLDLRLKISDIYHTFSELKEREAAPELSARTLPSVDDRYLPFTSDLKGRYIFDIESADGKQFGVSLASILNIYGCLPALAVRGGDSYDLFSDGQTVYSLMKGNAADMDTSALDSMFSFYEKFKSAMESDSTGLVKTGKVHDDTVKEVILKNLKRRFPVLLVRNGRAAVITGYTQKNGSETFDLYTYGQGAQKGISLTNDNCWVLDTFAYLLEISKEFNVSDRIDTGESFYENIRFTYPDGYDSSKIKAFKYDKSNSSLTVQEITFDTDNDIAKIGSPADGSCILAGLKTEYDGILPNLYGANKLYQVIQYEDLQETIADPWYYLYLFQATNRGIINGDIDENGVVNFNPQGDVTRAQFLKMVIEAAGIATGGVKDSPDVHWAKNYLDYALDNGLINQTQYQDPDANLPRCEAAYILSVMFIGNAAELQVPSLIYKYHTEIFTPKNVAWLEGSAFVDQGESNFYNADEVYQMYMNGVMEGDENHYFHPIANITRAEVCKAVMKCMFDLSADIKAAEVVFEGYTNFAEFDHEYTKPTSGWKDYHFNAERSGYYFVGVKGGDMTAHVDECSGGGTGGGLRYSRLTDDFTETYQSFGEGVPDYITNNMVKNGYSYKRFYLEKGTSFRVSGLQGNHTAFQVLAPKDGDIAFRPTGGGKMIISNSPEAIKPERLADIGSDSKILTQIKNLQPGKYTYLGWHTQYTSDKIRVDVKFQANQQSKIRLTAIGIQTPNQSQGEDWTQPDGEVAHSLDWTCTQAYANYKKCYIGGQLDKWYEENYNTLDVYGDIAPGSGCWLSELFSSALGEYPYLVPSEGSPIFIIADFEVIEGSVDFNEMAYRDIKNISEDICETKTAPYENENNMHSGIANTLPEVKTTLEYTITEGVANGYLPIRLFNSYNPMGYESDQWFTHINPQTDQDISALPGRPGHRVRDLSAESDVLRFVYPDEHKKGLYGANVPETQRKGAWYFDVYHSWQDKPAVQRGALDDSMGKEDYLDKENLPEAFDTSYFKPNSLLEKLSESKRANSVTQVGDEVWSEPTSFLSAAGGGNYSVMTTYSIKLRNDTDVPKVFEYHNLSWQNMVMMIANEQESNPDKRYTVKATGNFYDTYIKHQKDNEWMNLLDRVELSIDIPAHQTVSYTLTVVLVTAEPIPIRNYAKIRNQ